MIAKYYDVETDSEHPAYANLTLVGVLSVDDSTKEESVKVWAAPFTDAKIAEIIEDLCVVNDNVERVGFNNLNYDDLVLANHGVIVPEENTHDAMLAVKTCFPGLPAHGLKFLCFYLLGDPHWAEFELKQSGHRFGDLVDDKLKEYHKHDLYQHRNIWQWVLPFVVLPRHWEAYLLDMGMKFPLQEMTFEGGTYVDATRCETTMVDLLSNKERIQSEMKIVSGGKIQNANSTKQVGSYLDSVEDWALDLTATGEFQVKKKDLADITGMSEEDMRAWKSGLAIPEGLSSVALLAWQMKDNETLRKYVKNYLAAAVGTNMGGWIPNSYSISRAITRRTLSKSFYKINFQNSTEAIDRFRLIPPGFLGWFIDSTQIENVVHIYESGDAARRRAYEADEEWNEYVWLCNKVMGRNEDKAYWDSVKSRQIGHWSVYKVNKTAKLSLNFGQGATAYSKKMGLDIRAGREIFESIHRACPAIRILQNKVEEQLESQGFVQDVFGHIYTGKEAYKVVAYLIQGCGTGSLPKAQLRANYDTLHKWSEQLGTNVGPLATTTHDENSGFLRLDLGEQVLTSILQELMENMTSKFSHKFDGIPLRAKLYLSTTNTYDKKQHEQKHWRSHIIFP